ncbi:MAG: phytoene/squalene synthase family protein [Rhodobacteraceae bacterium]|nr:phytoene/squalene synthase family protein [Paracoccaceae bacterium]
MAAIVDIDEKWLRCQNRLLDDVSRTFALTIPQLPGRLRHAVGNAYLLCRIADIIEDEPTLDANQKAEFSNRFIEVMRGEENAIAFSGELAGHLSPVTSPGEVDLIRNVPQVIAITHLLNNAQRQSIEDCVRVMIKGMVEFQRNADISGLRDLRSLDRYCYCVAGVVGEMLTEMFCDHSTVIEQQRDQLFPLARSFGQGLQMTNILKDIWEDRQRGACWLPRDVFRQVGVDLEVMSGGQVNPDFAIGIRELIAIARFHLDGALKYTLMIPPRETGIRRHCLWAIGMAVLTLRRIHANPSFSRGEDVKISRRSVRATIFATNLLVLSDRGLKVYFALLSAGLPRIASEQ